jgi:hypothetical protein
MHSVHSGTGWTQCTFTLKEKLSAIDVPVSLLPGLSTDEASWLYNEDLNSAKSWSKELIVEIEEE